MNKIHQQFKSMTPDKEWKNSLKSELVLLAEKELAPVSKPNYFETFKSYFAFHQFAKVTTIASLVISIVAGGSILTVSASRDAIPGDTLYGVKRANEAVQDAMTHRPEARVMLKLSFAKERLNEAEKISQRVSDPVDSRQRVDRSMSDFQREIEEAQKYLDILKGSKGEVSKEIIDELVYFDPINNNEINTDIVEVAGLDDLIKEEIIVEVEDFDGTVEIAQIGELVDEDFNDDKLASQDFALFLAKIESRVNEYNQIFDKLKDVEHLASNGEHLSKAIEMTENLIAKGDGVSQKDVDEVEDIIKEIDQDIDKIEKDLDIEIDGGSDLKKVIAKPVAPAPAKPKVINPENRVELHVIREEVE